MLNDNQIATVWERQIASEVRSLYFAELANNYTTTKQWITFLSFFLSSGAAAALLGKVPGWIPVVLSVVVALMSAYSIAVSLDGSIRSMAKFHYNWSELATDYERLWNHVYSEDAEAEFERLVRRERDLSELATTEAPNNQKRLSHWQDQVLRQHHLSSPFEGVQELSKA